MRKSRASGRASESHVTTLIAFSRALRSAVEMPSRFSTATAITSTPRVIQVSTISFCLAGSGSVGPSQINFAPSSLAASSAPFRQEMKYAFPLLLGIMATVMGFVAGPVVSVVWLDLLQLAAPNTKRSEQHQTMVQIV